MQSQDESRMVSGESPERVLSYIDPLKQRLSIHFAEPVRFNPVLEKDWENVRAAAGMPKQEEQ
jgi:hypothetical protein